MFILQLAIEASAGVTAAVAAAGGLESVDRGSAEGGKYPLTPDSETVRRIALKFAKSASCN